MRVYLTGANGFLGKYIAKTLSESGIEVIGLVQRPDSLQPRWGIHRSEYFSLGKGISSDLFEGGGEVLIHCGWYAAWHAAKLGQLFRPIQSFVTNVEGTESLYEAAMSRGVKRLLFIGSLAAHEKAESIYGQHKLAVEKITLQLGGTVIKPGVILGPEPAANFSKYRKLVKDLPFLPDFFPKSAPLQTVWVEDVGQLVLAVIQKNIWGKSLIAAEPEGISMRQFYKGIGVLENKSVRIISIPNPIGSVMLSILRRLERIPDARFWKRIGKWSQYVLPPIRWIVSKNPIPSDSLAGWKCLIQFETSETSTISGVNCRKFSESLLTLSQQEKNLSAERRVLQWSRSN